MSSSGGELVGDLIPLVFYLREHLLVQESDGSEEGEVEGVLRLLQLPTRELEELLAEGGFCYDDLKLVKRIRQEVQQVILSSSSYSSQDASKPLLREERQGSKEEVKSSSECRGGNGNICHDRLALEAVRQQVAGEVREEIQSLSESTIINSNRLTKSQNKKSKLGGEFGGGGFSLFDFDNLPEFEPLQVALSLIKGDRYIMTSDYDMVEENDLENKADLSAEERGNNILMGLTKLLEWDLDELYEHHQWSELLHNLEGCLNESKQQINEVRNTSNDQNHKIFEMCILLLGRFVASLPGQQCLDSMLLFLRWFWTNLHVKKNICTEPKIDNHSSLSSYISDVFKLQVGVLVTVLNRTAEAQMIGLGSDMSEGINEVVALVFLILSRGELPLHNRTDRETIFNLLSILMSDDYFSKPFQKNVVSPDSSPSGSHKEDNERVRVFFLDRWMMQWNPHNIFRHAVNSGLFHMLLALSHTTSSNASESDNNCNAFTMSCLVALLCPLSSSDMCPLLAAIASDKVMTVVESVRVKDCEASVVFESLRQSGVMLWEGLQEGKPSAVSMLEVARSNKKIFQLRCTPLGDASLSNSIYWGIVSTLSLTSSSKVTSVFERIVASLMDIVSTRCKSVPLRFSVSHLVCGLFTFAWSDGCSLTAAHSASSTINDYLDMMISQVHPALGELQVLRVVREVNKIMGDRVASKLLETDCDSSSFHTVAPECFRLIAVSLSYLSDLFAQNLIVNDTATNKSALATAGSVLQSFAQLCKCMIPHLNYSTPSKSWGALSKALSKLSHFISSINSHDGLVDASVCQLFCPLAVELFTLRGNHRILKHFPGGSVDDVVELIWRSVDRDFSVSSHDFPDGEKERSSDIETVLRNVECFLFIFLRSDDSAQAEYISSSSFLPSKSCEEFCVTDRTPDVGCKAVCLLERMVFAGDVQLAQRLLSKMFSIDCTFSLDSVTSSKDDAKDIVTELFPFINTNPDCDVEQLRSVLLKCFALPLLWSLDWCTWARWRLLQCSAAAGSGRELRGGDEASRVVYELGTDVSTGVDEELFIECSLEKFLMGDFLRKSSPSACSTIPFTAMYLGGHSTSVEELASASADPRGECVVQSSPSSNLMRECSPPAATPDPEICAKYVHEASHDSVCSEVMQLSCTSGERLRKELYYSHQLIDETIDQSTITECDTPSSGSLVETAIDMLQHRFQAARLSEESSSSPTDSSLQAGGLASLYQQLLGGRLHEKSSGIDWWLLSYCLLNQLLVKDSSKLLKLPGLLLHPREEVLTLLEKGVDIKVMQCLLERSRDISHLRCSCALRITVMLLTKNILRNWFLNWMDIADVLTITSLVLLAPESSGVISSDGSHNMLQQKFKKGIEVCSVIVTALILHLLQSTSNDASCSDECDLNEVLDHYQRAYLSCGPKIRLFELKAHIAHAMRNN